MKDFTAVKFLKYFTFVITAAFAVSYSSEQPIGSIIPVYMFVILLVAFILCK